MLMIKAIKTGSVFVPILLLSVFRFKYIFLAILNFDSETVIKLYL